MLDSSFNVASETTAADLVAVRSSAEARRDSATRDLATKDLDCVTACKLHVSFDAFNWLSGQTCTRRSGRQASCFRQHRQQVFNREQTPIDANFIFVSFASICGFFFCIAKPLDLPRIVSSREAATACSRGCKPTESDINPITPKPRRRRHNQLFSPSNKYRRSNSIPWRCKTRCTPLQTI